MDVVLETLRTLVSYVRRSHSSSIRFQGFQALTSRLTAYASSWGREEEVWACLGGSARQQQVLSVCCSLHGICL